MEYARHPAGMRVVSVVDTSGRLVMFTVDEFVRCTWATDQNAYRISYEGSREVFVYESTAKELLGAINNQLRLSQPRE